jgi:tetratricopeptide (TPR) repeat protein
MRKKIFLLAMVMMGTSYFSFGQEQSNPKQSGMYKFAQMKYVFAQKYNDWRAASNALYDIIALDPSDDSVKLNLGYLYFENSIFASALFVSNDLLTRNPENINALRLSAMSYENMGVKAKAAESYETLYLLTESIDFLFTTAVLQFEIGRIAEARTNAGIVAKNPGAKDIKLGYPKNENEQQEIPMNAAAYFVLGVIEKSQGNKEEATSNFDKALAISPDFQLAIKEKSEIK